MEYQENSIKKKSSNEDSNKETLRDKLNSLNNSKYFMPSIIIGIATVGFYLTYTLKHPKKPQPIEKAPYKQTTVMPKKEINWPEVKDVNFDGMEDPMIYPRQSDYSKNLVLKGILTGEKSSTALVGKEMYHEGDEVPGGMVIQEIYEGYITVKDKTGKILEKRVGD